MLKTNFVKKISKKNWKNVYFFKKKFKKGKIQKFKKVENFFFFFHKFFFSKKNLEKHVEKIWKSLKMLTKCFIKIDSEKNVQKK